MSAEMNCHRIDDLLVEHVYEELPGNVSRDVDAHIEDCARCLAELQNLQATREAYRGLPDLEPAPRVTYDILREARKAAADRRDRPVSFLPGFLLTPAFGSLATLVLIGGVVLSLTRLGADKPVKIAAERAAPAVPSGSVTKSGDEPLADADTLALGAPAARGAIFKKKAVKRSMSRKAEARWGFGDGLADAPAEPEQARTQASATRGGETRQRELGGDLGAGRGLGAAGGPGATSPVGRLARAEAGDSAQAKGAELTERSVARPTTPTPTPPMGARIEQSWESELEADEDSFYAAYGSAGNVGGVPDQKAASVAPTTAAPELKDTSELIWGEKQDRADKEVTPRAVPKKARRKAPTAAAAPSRPTASPPQPGARGLLDDGKARLGQRDFRGALRSLGAAGSASADDAARGALWRELHTTLTSLAEQCEQSGDVATADQAWVLAERYSTNQRDREVAQRRYRSLRSRKAGTKVPVDAAGGPPGSKGAGQGGPAADEAVEQERAPAIMAE